MVERKAFLAKSNRQYRASQQGEHDWTTNNKKNGDYSEYPSLSPFTMNFNYKEMVKRKAFLTNPKHQCCLSQ